MKTRVILGTLGLIGGTVVLGQLSVNASTSSNSSSATGGNAPVLRGEIQPIGNAPDVYVLTISGFVNYGPVSGVQAYSVGTTSCNDGNDPLDWIANTNDHPVIGQNVFRWKPINGKGRFEQLGQSWLKHGFCALDLNNCGTCQGTGCSSLGINCSDPYTASRNGFQPDAGPKYDVNATNGFFNYPPPDPSYSGSVARRLQVLTTDVDAANNPGAVWYVECMYSHFEDCPATDLDRAADNASHRRLVLSAAGAITNFSGNTIIKQPAIMSWPTHDASATVTRFDVPNEGSIFVGNRVWDNGDGTWDYEYAVHNMNFDRSIGSIGIEVDDSVTITNVGFHDVFYHSGEPFSGTDWTTTDGANVFTWATQTFAQNANANAIRWATMYNFRFTANAGPVDGDMTIGYFKPGVSTSGVQTVKVPGAVVVPPCPADIDGNGSVEFNDVLNLLAAWGSCPGCPADVNGDDNVDFNDLLEVLAAWGPCP